METDRTGQQTGGGHSLVAPSDTLPDLPLPPEQDFEELTGDAYIGDMRQNLTHIKQLYRSIQRNKLTATRAALTEVPDDPRL